MYQALMEGLGYSGNRRPFIQLASLAPFHAVTEAARELPAGDRVSTIGGGCPLALVWTGQAGLGPKG
ncbi:MAG: hypothetical protein CL696_02450 [Chloroflexi bacterium]|nr:hypothetical protein [Chloroflexota bacterium]